MAWKPIHYRWQWRLKSSPQALWPYVADTQRFNQAVGLPSVEFSEIPLAGGGSKRIGQASRFGVPLSWEDGQFDWVQEHYFENTRTFLSGPMAQSTSRLSLQPTEDGTLLTYDIAAVPSNFVGLLGIYYQIGWESRRNFDRIFRQIDQALQEREAEPYHPRPNRLSAAARNRLKELAQLLTAEGYESGWVEQLVNFITDGDDLDLARIRPYVLAERWHAPRRTILEMCLSAAKVGLLNLSWDLLCPLCRGAKLTASSLDEVHQGIHCQTCNINFDADFSQNVELTFHPHPQIRLTSSQEYCIGGPMVTPHILVHQSLQPGEVREIELDLTAGRYRLRTQRVGVKQTFDIVETAASKPTDLHIRIQDDRFMIVGDQDAGPVKLTLTNATEAPQSFYLERGEWYTDAATAAEVTTLQHFRDLFSDEVLRPGEEIGIRSLTILFSDLVGSTAMYNRIGDAPSYAVVREQFAYLQRIVRRFDGAIVKTIGDAIMAAFVNPGQAVNAALAIQQSIDELHRAYPNSPLTIRLGLHTGPCIAVNLNGRLDYFGTTVNLAARLETLSQGNDIIVSKAVYSDPGIKALLATKAVQVEPFQTSIKGFDEGFELYRLTLNAITMPIESQRLEPVFTKMPADDSVLV